MHEGTAKQMSARAAWVNIGTLPVGYRPRVQQIITLTTPVINRSFLTMMIATNGVISIQTPQITDNVWLQGTGVFAL